MQHNIYKRLLTAKRLRPSTRGELSLPEEAESDRSRVLYSSAFRRLQGKTQVFPLDENAAVRTRLTHSFEVSHVGRYLGVSVLRSFREQKKIAEVGFDEESATAFITIVETACLLHDIGNPPFGHFGEQAISSWFKRNLNELTTKAGCEFGAEHKHLAEDFYNFDGNPQGFRILTRVAGADEYGFNLTYTQIASTLKYVCLPEEKDSDKPLRKKAGAFYSEQKALEEVKAHFGMSVGQRFPLAYLMEAADDISYCLSDIEDGIEKRIVTYDLFLNRLLEEAQEASVIEIIQNAAKTDANSPVDKVVSFRSKLIRHLVGVAAAEYVRDHEAMCAGSRDELIPSDSSSGKVLDTIKRCVRDMIYRHETPQGLELSGLAIIDGLLQRFHPLLVLSREEFACLMNNSWRKRHLDVEYRLLNLVAKRQRDAYSLELQSTSDARTEWWLRAHMLVDFVSGMTDQFALRLYQKLSGIRL